MIDHVTANVDDFKQDHSVNYRDGPITTEASGVDLQAIHEHGHDPVLVEHFDRHLEELFFTKLLDSSTEVEYRFVTRWESPDDL
jgi:hypothetical protein